MQNLARPLHVFVVLISIGLLSACNTLPESYKVANTITESELVDGVVFLGRPLADNELPDDKVMEITDEMEAFIQKYVLKANGLESRSRLLTDAIFDEDKLGMFYDPSQTYTARQAFENKVGNCLAFSFLYTALAERLGLDARFQEVEILPEWGEADDETYIESRHINIQLNITGVGQYIVDIDSIGKDQALRSKLLDAQHVEALYYGNVASDLLLEGRYEESFKYFVKGIKLKPSESSLWANFGVLYRRAGFNDHAEKAYFTALEHETRNAAALNNLAYLYKETDNKERAEYYAALAKASQSKNPYFRFSRAKKAMQDYQLDTALRHINYAINKNKLEPRFYKLKSEIHTIRGETREASKALRTAQEMEAETL